MCVPVHGECVHAPAGGSEGVALLEAKIAAGAELVITQPALIPSRHRAWWEAGEDLLTQHSCCTRFAVTDGFLRLKLLMYRAYIRRRSRDGSRLIPCVHTLQVA